MLQLEARGGVLILLLFSFKRLRAKLLLFSRYVLNQVVAIRRAIYGSSKEDLWQARKYADVL